MLTFAQIEAAQSNDLIAIGAVLAAMDERIARLAGQAARRMTDGDYREDFEQDAREALFVALPRFTGDSVDGFLGFMYSTIQDVLRDKVRAARYVGADKDAVKVFMSMLEQADGNAHRAEQMAQELPTGSRLSAARASAARIAWQGAVSIDKPAGDDEGTSIANTLAAPDETPEEIRPKVGHGAALEALSVLHRYTSAYNALAKLPATAEDVDAIEEAIAVPRDETIRRYVLDAVAILRSYVSTATEGALAEELRDVSDDRKDERAVKHNNVHATLAKMGAGQRETLKYTFGIDDYTCFGHGDGCDNEGLAALLGLEVNALRVSRTKGFKSFARYYIALVATTEADAVALADAAASNLARGGRK